MNILGIWDGHDSGAAVICDGRLVAAVNEERLTRRKLEIRFPRESIGCCLKLAGLAPRDIHLVASSTADIAKTLGRWAPSTKESYYAIRRRETEPGLLAGLRKRAKYWITEWGPNRASRSLSRAALGREIRQLGLGPSALEIYDHHLCHAAGAAYASRLQRCAILTIDGVGDGLSATVSLFRDGRLQRIAATPARDSLGVFFEHVTNLLNMRELEDEGKVMALADHAAPVPDEENPLMRLVRIDGLRVRLAVPGHRLRSRLRKILWRYPNEQFARMAQRTVERAVTELARAAVRHTGFRTIALAGGVASNVKANREIRLLADVDDVYVFPHMGDGGLAVGAAALAAADHSERVDLDLSDLALGPDYSESEMQEALDAADLPYTRPTNPVDAVADLIAGGSVVLWFQGRMEYGPRALGHRSVLARPDRPSLRDRLNLVLKRRVWYQPFCPSMLESDARACFTDWKGSPNRHMTMAYMVAPNERERLAGVLNVDGSCRPQIVSDEADGLFPSLLRAIKDRLGVGALLNTSFNIHGEPLVCTPAEAVDVYRRSGADALLLGPFLTRRAA